MRHLLILMVLAGSLTGCSSVALPTCDGKDRRPINAPASTSVLYPSCGMAA